MGVDAMRPVELFQPLSTSARVSAGLLLLRLVAGLGFVFHGYGKIQNPFGWMGPDAATPGIFQALAAVSEFGGGIAWMLGVLPFFMLCVLAGIYYLFHEVRSAERFLLRPAAATAAAMILVVAFVNPVAVAVASSNDYRNHPDHKGAAEFIVDGRPLLEHCEGATGRTFDLVSPFGWTPPDHQVAVAERLLLRQPPVLPTGRREFLVCPECADLGCGCISAVVRSQDGCYVWGDFGYENDYEPGPLEIFPMGRIVVPAEDVIRLLSGHVPGLAGSPGFR
jgi:uncharacterized membrane protein YphA (DoxX/SURF4 family)